MEQDVILFHGQIIRFLIRYHSFCKIAFLHISFQHVHLRGHDGHANGMGIGVIIRSQQDFAVIRQHAKGAAQIAVAVHGCGAFGFHIGMAHSINGIADIAAIVFRQHNVVQGRGGSGLFFQGGGFIHRIVSIGILAFIRFRFLCWKIPFIRIIIVRIIVLYFRLQFNNFSILFFHFSVSPF